MSQKSEAPQTPEQMQSEMRGIVLKGVLKTYYDAGPGAEDEGNMLLDLIICQSGECVFLSEAQGILLMAIKNMSTNEVISVAIPTEGCIQMIRQLDRHVNGDCVALKPDAGART